MDRGWLLLPSWPKAALVSVSVQEEVGQEPPILPSRANDFEGYHRRHNSRCVSAERKFQRSLMLKVSCA